MHVGLRNKSDLQIFVKMRLMEEKPKILLKDFRFFEEIFDYVENENYR